jgi:3-methyladenine DNA glycosylase AlkC
MADALKSFYDRARIRSIADELARVHPALDCAKFVRECLRAFDDLTLTQRAARIAEVMHGHLPSDYERAARLIIASLGPIAAQSESFGMAPFRYLPHVYFVARYGLEHFATSMDAQLELTQRFTAEFSIRSFIVRHPAATYAQLLAWSEHPSVHLRRLVSEGTRPRLPWAERLTAYQRDPRPVLALLERLKDDPERYVQRSVANNLNDIGKDHPDLMVEVCARWLHAAPPGRAWIVGHALRSLVKKGHRGALALLGAAEKPSVRVHAAQLLPARVKLGGALQLSLALVSTAKEEQQLVVDYAVFFVKADGRQRPKVFKLKRLTLPAQGEVRLATKVSFAQLTTRKHYPGVHRIELLVNGEPYALGQFHVEQ